MQVEYFLFSKKDNTIWENEICEHKFLNWIKFVYNIQLYDIIRGRVKNK